MSITVPGMAPTATSTDPDPDRITRLGGATTLANAYLRVDTDDVIFPDGRPGTYNTVTVAEGNGVVAVPTTRWRGLGYVGLVEQYRYPLGRATLEFPRGGSLDGSFEEAARELVEETGLVATTGRKLGVVHPDTGILTNEVSVWLTSHETGTLHPAHVEPETGARFRWFGVGEFDGLIANGKITCGITLAAFAMLGIRNIPLFD
ncbi:NUDIX hydrolase [Tersicoccus sp. MR15.9]|uniref:NUDIX hydrolase n=1 Tax=Tersicoccus mangrovi TaxID=3121635 RepID=UPI002FE5087B